MSEFWNMCGMSEPRRVDLTKQEVLMLLDSLSMRDRIDLLVSALINDIYHAGIPWNDFIREFEDHAREYGINVEVKVERKGKE